MDAVITGAITEFLPVLVCGGGMALCMRMMLGSKKSCAHSQHNPSVSQMEGPIDQTARISYLEAEVERLRVESSSTLPE